MKDNFKILIVFLVLIIVGCDKDQFADLNSDPSTLAEPDLRFSVTQSVHEMYNNDYTVWFYNNFDYVYPWSQITSVGNGNSEAVVEMGATGGQSIYGSLFPNTRDIRARIDVLEEEEKESMRAIRAMTFAIQIHPAITNTDNTGSMVYTEAALAPYTTPALLTPTYDNQELLFKTWLEELDAAIIELGATDQFAIGNQDLIYGGDYGKWAKFCNLLKLKIAARLVNKDRAQALRIAEEVASSSAGIMNTVSDDFLYRRDINYTGTGNGMQPGIGSKNLVDFMVNNKDPRVRVLFAKNEFNAEIIQAFIDADVELPFYVSDNISLDGGGDFESWTGLGEPWVRYYGAPLSPDANFLVENDPYFKQDTRNRISVGDIEKTYSSTSDFNERITRTGAEFTYPTKPGGRVIQIQDNFPALKVVLGSAAETNLYLAEFKMLGANLPESAQEYFNRGVRLSVERMDLIAKNNGFPYYESDPVYEDEIEAANGATKLQGGEIDALLALPAYDLGTDGLEKIYIQQYINLAATPGDVWALTRRSGIPKTGSAILPREAFLSAGIELVVPRRFEVGTPNEESLNFQNYKSSLEEQGFTSGTNDPSILNSERIWFDQENPAYGAGPKN